LLDIGPVLPQTFRLGHLLDKCFKVFIRHSCYLLGAYAIIEHGMTSGSYVKTPEHREHLRQAMLGKKHSPGWRENVRQAILRRPPPSAESRERMSQAAVRNWPTKREKLRQANQERPCSAETREALRQAALNQTPEHRRKTSECMQNRIVSPETRQKAREARLRQRFPLTDIERILLGEFKKRRLKFEMHKGMFGRWQPDFVFESAKLVVQADGGFWHNRRAHPASVARDDAFNAEATKRGWTVFRFSDTEIEIHPAACGRAVARFVRDHV